ncbi:MAG: hypothetical protein V4457_06130 [Pseudomonadota bacterium]
MATQQEATAKVAALSDAVNAIGVEVAKVGTETDGLIKAVADLTAAAGNVQTSPEFDAALAAANTAVANVQAAVQGVDDKVADATA